jgi:hypothetical protein
MSRGVPALTPADYDPTEATEERERAQVGAREPERSLEAEELNRIWNLPAYNQEIIADIE